MNEYRITANGTADSITNVTITAIDEHDARRIFKSLHKDVNPHTIGVVLIRENVCATKQQEREALERIRAILLPLGPRSYCGTAFEGCLEDAEHNIDDDAAYSMKARYEEVREKLRHEIAERQAIKKELERARQALRDAESNVEYLGRKVEEAQGKAISADLWNAVYNAAMTAYNEAKNTMAEAAEKIVQHADSPECPAFGAAVREYRLHKKARDETEKIMGRLEGIAPDGAKLRGEAQT